MKPAYPHSYRHLDQQAISRRHFLALIGLTSVSAVAACSATAAAAYLFLVHDRRDEAATPAVGTIAPTSRAATFKAIDRPAIISRQEWGARAPNLAAENESGLFSDDNPEGRQEYESDLRDVYRTVVIHHSVIYEVDDLTTMHAVQDMHLDERGWSDIAYHFCVGASGTVYEGRLMRLRGTHTAGYNTGSLGVCLLGNFEMDTPSAEQLEATQSLVNWLALRLELSHLAGHREFNPETRCPGENLAPLLDDMALGAGLERGTEGYQAPVTDPEVVKRSQQGPEQLLDCGCCQAV
ncbi:MAG: hypothetical protein GYB66_13645 [Chloroflexi bacterium]|nr:hypothetical protein [Chloroflexota bacterium]